MRSRLLRATVRWLSHPACTVWSRAPCPPICTHRRADPSPSNPHGAVRRADLLTTRFSPSGFALSPHRFQCFVRAPTSPSFPGATGLRAAPPDLSIRVTTKYRRGNGILTVFPFGIMGRLKCLQKEQSARGGLIRDIINLAEASLYYQVRQAVRICLHSL
jgi:hypothetical protein